MSGAFRFFDITVTARADGEKVAARLVCCSECLATPDLPTFFIVYTIAGHQHLQCSECGTTYCDGSCES
jgi:hypothetical protein